MADTVQELLERMIPELEELQEIGYFDKNEVRQIVNERRDYEYKLAGRSPRKEDYLNYITYELKLESLRKLRKKKLSIKKSSSSDYVYLRRVHFIFDRALRRFRYDLDLWKQWIEFSLRTNSSKALQKIFPRALRLLPHCEKLWLQAASWEFDVNHNISGARHFMQRALRFNSVSKDLWLHYFKLELLYIRRLQARRMLLGLDDVKTGVEQDVTDSLDSVEQSDKKTARKRAFFDGLVPRIIYNNAVSNIEDVEFSAAFAQIVRGYRSPEDSTSPGFPRLQDYILNDITDKFPISSKTWILLAENCVYHLQYVGSRPENEDREEKSGPVGSYYALEALGSDINMTQEVPSDWTIHQQSVSAQGTTGRKKGKRRQPGSLDEFAARMSESDSTSEKTANIVKEAEDNMIATLREGLTVAASPFFYIGAVELMATRLEAREAPKTAARLDSLTKSMAEICLRCHTQHLSTVKTHSWLLRSLILLQWPCRALAVASDALSAEFEQQQKRAFGPLVEQYVTHESVKEKADENQSILRSLRSQSEPWLLGVDLVLRFRSLLSIADTRHMVYNNGSSEILQFLPLNNVSYSDFSSEHLQEIQASLSRLPSVDTLLEEALKVVLDDFSLPLWLYSIGIKRDSIHYAENSEFVTRSYLTAISRCTDEDPLRLELLEWLFEHCQISFFQKWKKEIFSGTPSFSIYQHAINRLETLYRIENFNAAIGALLEYVYQQALRDHGKASADLWLRRMRFLQENSRSIEASKVYDRALKELDNPSTLVELCASGSARKD
eukprot:gb/GECG01009800.1/.p1 GENE.gb/GECG01009800.1/~~gb/GECG01009800.1/.p1  ORF type:complete len:783 (+),score=104.37 gb/GECG01009800.1/:1-2349(+)